MTRNRFAILLEEDEEDEERDMNKPPPQPPPKKHVCIYSLTTGSESVQHVKAVPVQHLNERQSALNAISFFGRCFQCQYMSHSQKYCPLRQCKACKQYGHSETVCRRQKSAGRAFLEPVERANGLHGLLLTAVADADAEVEESNESGESGESGSDDVEGTEAKLA